MGKHVTQYTNKLILICAVVVMTVAMDFHPVVSVAQTVTPSSLVNISTRAGVQTGDNVMIGGFWISGTNPKTVLIRARGGSLGGAPFNNPGVLANPTMQLFSGSTVIAQNNDWQSTDPLCVNPATACGGEPEISATGLDPCQPNPGQTVAPPGCAQESALLVTLPPGGYTAIVSGVGGTSGLGLAEVFEVGTSASALVNISTRSRVQTGANVMIGGFWIGGSTPQTVLVRARGGSLGGAPFNNPGVLANPVMQLYSGSTVIAQNDDWQTNDSLCLSPATTCGNGALIRATAMDPCQPNPGQTVAPPGCGQEAALLVTLPPGGYTTIVSGAGGGAGVGLVEVFETTMPAAPVNSTPVANAGGPYTALTWDLITLDGSGSVDVDGDPLTYTWDFGDGTTGGGATPTHYYSEAGTYTVSVTVTDPYNASHTASTTATITAPVPVNYAPIANAGGPYAGVVGEVLTFSAVGSVDPNGDPLTYAWNFGDGFTGVGVSVSHAYAAAGTYSVTVTATDSGSVSNSVSTTATISVLNPSNSAPTVSVTVPSQGLVLQNLVLIGSGSDPDNDTLSYRWTFGDGTGTAFGPTPSAVHEYAQAGTYTATLTANDGQGHSVSASGTVTITLPATPVAFSQSRQIGRRSGNVGDYMHRRAIELDGAGVPPLQFNIVDYPDHWASDAQSLNIGYGAYYQWWNPVANQWRPECHSTVSVPPSCAAPFWSHVHPGTGAITMTAPATPPTVGYLPERCWIWSGLTDSFSFTVTDGNGVTSAPAVVTMTLSATTCHAPTF